MPLREQIWSYLSDDMLYTDREARALIMQTLLEVIGWPLAPVDDSHGTSKPNDSKRLLRGGGHRSSEDELKVQLLTLQVVRVPLS